MPNEPWSGERVGIVVLAHNAPRLCHRLLLGLRRTHKVATEVVVVDNRSSWFTKLVLLFHFLRGVVDWLCLLNENTLFAKGNNSGVGVVSRECTHVLLLNSDVEIRRGDWLRALIDIHERGATGLSPLTMSNGTFRADGWCLLGDADLYRHYQLDEAYEWWFGPARLQADLLRDGYCVKAVRGYGRFIRHIVHGSGPPPPGAKGMDTPLETVEGWFEGRGATVIERLGGDSSDHDRATNRTIAADQPRE